VKQRNQLIDYIKQETKRRPMHSVFLYRLLQAFKSW